LGFDVEGGTKAADKLRRPVLFGEMGAEERAYEVDAFHGELGVALEVEAGRGTQGNAIYRDLIQTGLLIDARFLAGCSALWTRAATERHVQRRLPLARTGAIGSAVLGSVSSVLWHHAIDARAHRQARDPSPPGLRATG
jgi:hypothetical protein